MANTKRITISVTPELHAEITAKAEAALPESKNPIPQYVRNVLSRKSTPISNTKPAPPSTNGTVLDDDGNIVEIAGIKTDDRVAIFYRERYATITSIIQTAKGPRVNLEFDGTKATATWTIPELRRNMTHAQNGIRDRKAREARKAQKQAA